MLVDASVQTDTEHEVETEHDLMHASVMVNGKQVPFVLKVPKGTKLTGTVWGACTFDGKFKELKKFGWIV